MTRSAGSAAGELIASEISKSAGRSGNDERGDQAAGGECRHLFRLAEAHWSPWLHSGPTPGPIYLDQEIIDTPITSGLKKDLGWAARLPSSPGAFYVHVGIRSVDRAVAIMRLAAERLLILLAALGHSRSSWTGGDTGLASSVPRSSPAPFPLRESLDLQGLDRVRAVHR